MNKRIVFFSFVLCGLLLTGCRYEEPAFSFKTPENRLVGIWVVKKTEKNGKAYVETDYEIAIKNTLYYFHYGGPMEVKVSNIWSSNNASWQFVDKSKKIQIYIDMPRRSYNFTANIIRLSNGEMKYEYDDANGDHWYLEFAKQSNSF